MGCQAGVRVKGIMRVAAGGGVIEVGKETSEGERVKERGRGEEGGRRGLRAISPSEDGLEAP